MLIKGSNAYRYHLGENDGEWSDMDLIIYINPNLPNHTWERIKTTVHTETLRAMSMYKRAMDHMFCFNRINDDRFLSEQEIEAVKRAYAQNLAVIVVENGKIQDPFTDLDTRNKASRNSFVITESKVFSDHNVKIDIPHFPNCERVTLPRTPIYLSYNSTIKYKKNITNQENGILFRVTSTISAFLIEMILGCESFGKIVGMLVFWTSRLIFGWKYLMSKHLLQSWK